MSSSTTSTTETFSDGDVLQFLRERARSHRLDIRYHDSMLRDDGDFLYVPASLDLADAYEKAEKLQMIEDEWNTREPKRYPRIILVPTKD